MGGTRPPPPAAAAVDGASRCLRACCRADFERIDAELREYDAKRETVIKKSRDIQKAAKQVPAAAGRRWVRWRAGGDP